MDDPRIPADPRLIKLLSFMKAPVLPKEVRIDPSIIEAMEAFSSPRGGKTRHIRVKILKVAKPAWDFSLLQALANVIKLSGFGITATGQSIEFPMDLQQQGNVLRSIGEMALFAEAELDLAQLEHSIDVLTANGVLQVDALPRITPDLDLSVPALFQSQPANVPDRKGRSALLGVVDFGCDFVHPNFRDDDEDKLAETRLEALVVIDSSGNAISHPRATINQVLNDRNPYKALLYYPHAGRNQPHAAYDPGRFGAHGTLVLDAAAGNGQSTRIKGVAPQARLTFVQLESDKDGNPPQISVRNAIKEIFKLANVPAVVNLSLNPNSGPRNGFGSLAVALSEIPEWDHGRQPGRAIVVAAGNFRGAGLRSAGRSLHRGGSSQDAHALRVMLPDEHAPTDQIIRIYHPLGTKFCITFTVPPSMGQPLSMSLDPDGPQHSWPRDGKFIQTCRRTGAGVMETTMHLKTAALEKNRRWTFFVTLPTPVLIR